MTPSQDPTSIGEILWRSLATTRGQLREALDAQREQPDEKLGALLVIAGHITQAELDEALEIQKGLRSRNEDKQAAASQKLVSIVLQRAS